MELDRNDWETGVPQTFDAPVISFEAAAENFEAPRPNFDPQRPRINPRRRFDEVEAVTAAACAFG